jgi:hypothetical protein
VFSHYRIAAPLGAGGMGQVFVATDLNLSRRVALKVVPDSLVSAGDAQSAAEFRRRFHHEAEALAQLDCDHVIRIYEHGEFEGTPFIATQYVAGGELGTLLRHRGSMPSADAALVCSQIAEALAEAHDVGIVHRDVKPSTRCCATSASPNEDPQKWLRDRTQPVVTVADLDGDGDDDAVTRRTVTSPKQAIHLSDGTSFGNGTRIFEGLPVEQMLPGDFDGDGTEELVRASRDHLQLLVYEYENGKFARSTWSDSSGKSYDLLAVGDFDGDGLDDVASYVEKEDKVRFGVSISAGDMFDDPVPWGTWTCGCQGRFSPLSMKFFD